MTVSSESGPDFRAKSIEDNSAMLENYKNKTNRLLLEGGPSSDFLFEPRKQSMPDSESLEDYRKRVSFFDFVVFARG